MKTYSIRIETEEKEEVNDIVRELEKSFQIEGSIRSYRKRDGLGWLHYIRIRQRSEQVCTGSDEVAQK